MATVNFVPYETQNITYLKTRWTMFSARTKPSWKMGSSWSQD